MDANAPPTDVPASPLLREVPRRLRFAAPIATSAVRLLLCLISLATTACTPTESSEAALILLFNGTGVSVNDVAAIESVLRDRGLEYSTANSEQLNGMSESQLMAYRLLIVPGGNYIEMGDGFSPETSARIRQAVQNGLNYLGICAGGILAGDGPHNHLNLTAGVGFDFYAEVNRGIHKTAVLVAGVDEPAIEHYWEDGPQFTGWGAVVGKYPDGTPAIAQGTSGKGWVILCGTHPEAPANWREGMSFTTPVDVSNAYAGTLIDAALHRTRLPQF